MIARLIEKPWGQLGVTRDDRGQCTGARVGEVCFDHPERESMPVLIKYLYTTERLSIQVHPNNHQARAMGHASGKDEMWIVLDAEPGATIGLGLVREAGPDELREAVESGSIEQLVDWRPVSPGDVIYNPAGTIHAAGAGLKLLEVQQSIDLTYRLYDYGRPRELHLAEGLAVAQGRRHHDYRDCSVADGVSRVLVTGPYFGAAWCQGSMPTGIPRGRPDYQLVVVEGEAFVAGTPILAGECCLVSDLSDIVLPASATAVLAWAVAEAEALAVAA